LHGGLQGFFLRCAVQLPKAQRQPQQAEKNSRCSHAVELWVTIQKIILCMSYFVALGFLAVIASLATALFFMLRGGSGGPAKSRRMARALALRVGSSILLFVCILLSWQAGWIQPTGIPPGT
jgi:hypothetical protein